MRKREWLSLLLCVAAVMVMTMLHVTVRADSVPENYLFDISEGSVTIGNGTNAGTVKVTYGEGSVKDNIAPSQPITVTGTTTENNITVTDSVSVTVVLQDLTIDVSEKNQTAAVNLDGAGACTIQLVGENVLKAGNDRPGIYVPQNNQITFTGIGTGRLNVTGGDSWPGIGRNGSGNILIESGIIVSKGGLYASGIGGSCGFEGGSITIDGGEITANGGIDGAGIGGGSEGSGGTISINGGIVTATGGSGGAGIGGGRNGSGGTFQTQKTGEAKGNAVIFASSITDQSGKAEDAANPWSGVIFISNDGKVYGSTVTPIEDFTIDSGKSLLVPTGSILNISVITAVNNGNVYVDGAVSGLDGDLYYPLTVTGGTASGDVSTYQTKVYGKANGTVTLTGTDVPVGQAVSGWTTSDGGVTVENNAFTMPDFALTVTAQYIDAPVLSDFSITQGDTPNSYTVKFTSDQAGTWYYIINRKDTSNTSNFTGWISGTCVAGENTITLTDQIAGEKIHLAVVNQYGLCSTVIGKIENDDTALFNGLFAMYMPFVLDTPVYQHDAPSKEALEALLTERMNEYINSAFDFENRTEEELEILRTLTTQMIVKQYVPAIAATAGTNGVDGSFIFEMEGSLCGWSTVAFFCDSDYEEIDPTVIAEPYYTVTLNADGGTVNSGNVTGYVYGVGATLPTDMTRWGYGFVGWYDDETGEKVTAVSGTDWSDRSFTAHWTIGGVNPTYTVTIPATVELGGIATVSVSGLSIVEGSQLVVTLSGSSDTGNVFKLSTDEGAELNYSITKDSTALNVGSTVLTVAGGTANNSGSATLTFSKPTTAIQYSGTYKGTVTFTVSIEEVYTP